jgi:hypothetical protein
MKNKALCLFLFMLLLILSTGVVSAKILYVENFDDFYESMDIWRVSDYDDIGKLVWNSI